MAMIDVIRADEMSRLGVCAQDDCAGSSSTSRATARRSSAAPTCSNRAAVAAYRARNR